VRAHVAAYYRDPRVHARLREYCGSEGANLPSAVFVAGFDSNREPFPTWWDAEVVPAASLDSILERGCDVSRSLWDTQSLIFLIDLDYQNLDYPSEPFTHSTEVFFKLEGAYATTLAVLRASGIRPLISSTGRGYHFVGRVPLDAPVVDLLAVVGGVPSWHARQAAARSSFGAPIMTERQAAAAEGLGLVTEYLAHAVLRRAAERSIVPVVLNGTTVGSGLIGRECISIDFSHVGDPLNRRHVRIGFSAYQWHRARPDIFGDAVSDLAPIACVPRTQRSLEAFIRTGRTLGDAAEVARHADCILPDISVGVARALDRYKRSGLAAFHRDFAAELVTASPSADLDIPADLPPCITWPLAQPNDLLLKPEHLQNLVRGLTARGWTAARIARLVAREYESDHAWGDRWKVLDAQTRANFDVRVFAGLLATGADRLVDFNCMSSQEKGVCPRCGCTHDLREDRDRLLERFHS
jgi:hypothetical protein